jgi:DNA modification methylase
LVWLKSDNAGVAASAMYGPRHVYETALMASRGKRPIVRVKADGYAAPRDPKLHQSTKPVPVLRHFFEMLVDEHSTVLDPTAGSGSALIAAESLGAPTVLGLEIDEVQCGLARLALRQFRSLKGLAQ